MFKPPNYSDTQIAHMAGEVLASFSKDRGITLAPPIPVEDILEKHLKLTLKWENMEKFLGESGILGAAWIDENLVRVEGTLFGRFPGRYFFTLAHECGHWRIHRPLIIVDREMPTLFSKAADSKPPTFICRSDSKDKAEWQADKFAARLLMPEHMVRVAFAKLFPGGIRGPLQLCPPEKKDERKEWLLGPAREMIDKGGFSNCSREAMRNRIDDLKLVDFSGNGVLF